MWISLRRAGLIAMTSVCASHAVAQADPDLKPGFPVMTWHGSGSYRAGPSIHPVVGNIDADPELEIVFSGLAQGPLYAFNHDGSDVTGWPVDMGYVVALPVLAKLNTAVEESQVFAGAWGTPGPMAAFSGDGTLLPGWPKNSANYVSTSPSAADIDGDGVDELFVCEENFKINAYHADGSTVAGWQYGGAVGSQRCTPPAIADLDGDGQLEIITVDTSLNNNSLMYVFEPDGTRRAGFPVQFPADVGTYPVVGDVDGDGAQEIVVAASMASSPWHIVLHVYSAQGQLERQIPIAEESPYGTAPALADLDLDGHPDIIVQARWNVYAIKGTDGTLLPGWPQNVGSDGNSSPAVGDVDGDGLPDIAVTSEVGKIYLFDRFGVSNAHFPKTLALGHGAVPAIADIDGDGRNDLVVMGDFWNGIAGYYDKLWVYDLQGPSYGPIEWGQFGAGAQHHSVYIPKTSHQLRADVGIALAAASQPPRVGDTTSFTGTVTNYGPETATQLRAVFALPSNLTFVAADAGCVHVSGIVTCRADQLPNGSSRAFAFSARATAAGSAQVSANLRTSSADTAQTNNTSVATTTIGPPPSADLAITVTDAPDPARVGRDLVYTIRVTNIGPDAANAVQVTFGAPADVIIYSVPTNCVQTASINCNLGNVAAGGAAEVRLVGTPQYPLPIAVTATVSSSTADPVTSNNTASASTTVRR